MDYKVHVTIKQSVIVKGDSPDDATRKAVEAIIMLARFDTAVARNPRIERVEPEVKTG